MPWLAAPCLDGQQKALPSQLPLSRQLEAAVAHVAGAPPGSSPTSAARLAQQLLLAAAQLLGSTLGASGAPAMDGGEGPPGATAAAAFQLRSVQGMMHAVRRMAVAARCLEAAPALQVPSQVLQLSAPHWHTQAEALEAPAGMQPHDEHARLEADPHMLQPQAAPQGAGQGLPAAPQLCAREGRLEAPPPAQLQARCNAGQEASAAPQQAPAPQLRARCNAGQEASAAPQQVPAPQLPARHSQCDGREASTVLQLAGMLGSLKL